jgi:ribosomal protein L11 methyltransferase
MVDNAPATAAHTARLVTDRETAQRLADFLTESLAEQDVVVAAFESDGGQWTTAVYFSASPNKTAIRALVALELGAELANALVFERVEAKDWVAASLKGLIPVAAGRFLVHGRHDRVRVPANRIGVEIEAALAFGTGHHGSTHGCLLALDRLVKQSLVNRERAMRIRVLDVGTGTGVLAIAAAKALRTHLLASDIDPRALRVARENAQLNKVAPAIEFIQAAGLEDHRFRERGPFNLILANILLAPLQRLARPLARLLSPGAHVVLSGLLNNQAQTALVAYRAQGLVLKQRIILDEWTTLVLRR